jgi:hypothetical protein
VAYSYVQYTGNGSTTNYVFSFPYLETSHIKVRVNGVITSFTFLNSSTVTISPAPANGAIIDIRRETPKDSPPVDFTDGSVLLEADLDLLAKFSLYTAQESSDGVSDSMTKDSLGVWQGQSRRIKEVADPINANDAVNKTWAETAMSSQLASATTQASNAASSATAAAGSASTASTQASLATTKASEASASATAASNSATAASGSASSAAGSATTATTKATEAAASASTASTKASEASTSATAAAGSASSASASASTASTQATNSANSATSASNSASTATTQAGIATTKANEASASATAAASSASSANSSANAASTSASNAATSATNAATSATNAANSATQATTNGAAQVTLAAAQVSLATTQATNAANSATAASNSASAAATSATSAAASASSAAALLDNFDDRYLGPKASAPTVDNDGNALIVGALYFDTTTGKMRVFTASGWLDASSASVATLANFQFNATAGQTTFSGTAAVGGTLSYTVGAVMVALNGVLLESPSEFTASNGTSIVLASGAALNDELNVYAFGNFLVADTYSRAEADAKYVPNTTGVINIGSGQVYKDSLGNVGIGTTNPSSQLHLNKSGTGDYTTMRLSNSGASGRTYEVGLGGNTAAAGYANSLYFYDSTAGALRMAIDSAGRVTMPAQPAFTASGGTNASGVVASVQFTTISLNRGGHYNFSNGRFTAPVSGVYFFSASVDPLAGGASSTQMQINGFTVASLQSYATNNDGSQSVSAALNLNAGDYVSIRTNAGFEGSLSHFTGFLIG